MTVFLTIREARAGALARALDDVDLGAEITLEDLVAHPRFAAWPRLTLEIAIADVVEDGILYDTARGFLRRRPPGGLA